jgi:tRNA nucleotidyltransferase (CCA-adding enzyme)
MRSTWEDAQAVCRRLKFSVELSQTIQEACQLWQDLPALRSCPASLAVERLENLRPLSRFAVFAAAGDASLQQPILEFVFKWQFIVPTIDGNDLRARGLPPGPAFRQILKGLRTAWLNGLVTNRDEEAQYLEKTLSGLYDEQND